MAINQLNNYLPGQDLTNLANNVDYNRLGDDKTQITVNFAVSPAEVTILQGSLWECNGNIYTVDADYTFAMANAAHNYITFTDNPVPAFSSAAVIGVFDSTKQGYYDAGTNLIRTLAFYIDQSGEAYMRLIDACLPDIRIFSSQSTKLRAYKTSGQATGGGLAKITWDATQFDITGEFDLANDRFVVTDGGLYLININAVATWTAVAAPFALRLILYIDAAEESNCVWDINAWAANDYANLNIDTTLYLVPGQVVEVYVTSTNLTNFAISGSPVNPKSSWICITRLI